MPRGPHRALLAFSLWLGLARPGGSIILLSKCHVKATSWLSHRTIILLPKGGCPESLDIVMTSMPGCRVVRD
ncbi:hypothetical protein FIBSPDRAFT_857304, partial [Athelia psychrophila]